VKEEKDEKKERHQTNGRMTETMYFRFFVGENDYCKTIQVAAEAEYGSPVLTASNIRAYPNVTDQTIQILNNHFDIFDYADSALWFCPNANKFYERGTYAVGVTAGTPTSFVLKVAVSTQTLPIPDPPVRIKCDDVPSEEKLWGNDSICVEDGVTTDVFIVSLWKDFFNIYN